VRLTVVSSADAYVYVRLLIAKTKELDEIRGSSKWRKALETDSYKGRIDRILNEMKEATDNFCVSIPYFIDMSRVATAEASSLSDRLVPGYRKGHERYRKATLCENHESIAIIMHHTHCTIGNAHGQVEAGPIRPI
jgi:hypothetical protein